MTLLDDVPVGAVVGLDTAPLIYFTEGHAQYGPVVRPFFEDRLEHDLNQAVTSVISLAEVLVKPLSAGQADLVQTHRDFFAGTRNLTLLEVSSARAERAAELRAKYGIRLPDAIQVAAALDRGATLFISNDHALRKVTELKVLILDDYLPAVTP